MLFIENVFALSFYTLDPVLSVRIAGIPDIAQQAMTTLRVLESAALAFRTWVTRD